MQPMQPMQPMVPPSFVPGKQGKARIERQQKFPPSSHIYYQGRLATFYLNWQGKSQIVVVPAQRVFRITEIYPLDLHFLFQEIYGLMYQRRVSTFSMHIFKRDWEVAPHLFIKLSMSAESYKQFVTVPNAIVSNPYPVPHPGPHPGPHPNPPIAAPPPPPPPMDPSTALPLLEAASPASLGTPEAAPPPAPPVPPAPPTSPASPSGNLGVQHVDGDPHNNRPDNLVWATPAQNEPPGPPPV